ncbi:unnamed protein product [Cuscuta europaea]|uniref:C3H1-type domain-containing protein n=1 Tax=Cuscuta europaea TaxID=41803 RepID=A0A9P0ZJ09_CUSEU|nr:unnamed protein product [Cuscuta europaea]
MEQPFHNHHQRYVYHPPSFPDSPNCFHRPPPPPPPHPNLHPPLPPSHHYHHPLPPYTLPFHSVPHPENPRFLDYIHNRDSSPTPHPMRTLDPWADVGPRLPLHQPPRHHQPSFLLPLDDQNDNYGFARDEFFIPKNGFRGDQERIWGRQDTELDNVDVFRFNRERPIQHRLDIRDDREDLRWGYEDVTDVMDSSSRRRLSSDNGYAFDHKRLSNRVRDGIEELHRSPRKKNAQKRSAPHTIPLGKANHRTRNQDWHSSNGYVDNSSVAGSRGNLREGIARSGKREEERENSPVELDVSFKSNALVAKAIVAPSSPVVDTGKNGTPRARKIRRLKMPDTAQSKLSEKLGKLENSANGLDCPLSSGPSGSEKETDIASNTCTPSKEQVHDQVTYGVQNDKTPLRKNRCKKKVMAYVMKKNSFLDKGDSANLVIGADISVDKLSVSELNGDSLRADERIASDGMKQVQDSFSSHHLTEELAIDKIYEPLEPVVSGSDASKNDSSSLFKSKRKRNCLSVISVSESLVDPEIKEHTFPESKLLENCQLLDSETCIIEPQTTVTSSIIDKETKGQHFQNHASMLKTNLVPDSNGHMLSIGNFGLAHSSYSDETIIHKGGMCIRSSTEDACAERTENIVAEGGSLYAGSEQSFDNTSTVPDTDAIPNGPRDSDLLVRDISNVSSLNKEEGFLSASISNPCSSSRVISDNGCPCTDKKALPESCFPNIIDRVAGPHRDASPIPLLCVEDHHDPCLGKEYSPEMKIKRKVSEMLSKSSCLRTSEDPCRSMVLSLGMNHASNESNVTAPGNGDCSLDGGQSLQECPQNDLSVQGDLETGSIVTSPRNLKKRKISSPTMGHSILYESLEMIDEANMSAPGLSNGGNAVTHTLSQALDNCCAALPPCARPMENLNEKSTTSGSFQAESTQVGPPEVLSDLEHVPSFPSHMLASEKEATAAVLRSGDQNGILDRASRICGLTSLDDMVPTEGDSESHDGLPASNFSAEIKSCIFDMSPLNSSSCQVSNGVLSQVNRNVTEASVSTVDTIPLSGKNSPDKSKADSDAVNENLSLNKRPPLCPVSGNLPIISRRPSSLPDACEPLQTLKYVPIKSNFKKSKMSSVVLRGSCSSSAVSFMTPKRADLSKHAAKSRTWHRTSNSSSAPCFGPQVTSIRPQNQRQSEVTGIHNSYIRKGNTLVRNYSYVGNVAPGFHASSSSVYRLSSSNVKDAKKFKSDNVVEITDQSSCLKPFEPNSAFPQSLNSELLNSTGNILGNPASLPGADKSGSCSLGIEVVTGVTSVHRHSEDALKIYQCQSDPINKLESENTSSEGKSREQTFYSEQRSHQLVAAPDATPTSSSDGYYKMRNNQLVRTITENHVNPKVAANGDSINPKRQGAEKAVPKKRSGSPDAYKSSKFSLVWTLSGSKSSRGDGKPITINHKVQPYWCSWKRYTNLRSFTHGLASVRNVGAMSTISRKLLLSRKRHTVYTRSANGHSLRRSKVLSVGGTSLKWSKSIERNSKKADQEATLAVAAAEKTKRGQNIIATSNSKSRNSVSRERIFRIGSERYKMDPSGKTLQRISSDEEPEESILRSESNVMTSYIPRRLLIGNDEYVRLGSGNKLVRNPKRRVRILANQKVRWSLHTARLRLAKKSTYCQFFTRFGKCNKDNRKCPYIHDPSKIAVCTKFLSGSCSNPDCKLTHKVIPERMQDCSYFQQGLCSNENCPYRHVNVNPNSSVCEGFLRGYCSDGDECQRKHSYVCPSFEATGDCPQGSKCKLHHPKIKSKRRKWRGASSNEKKNDLGRYFGSPHIDLAECVQALSGKPSVEGDEGDSFFKQGRSVEYISLGVVDSVKEGEDMMVIDQVNEETCEGEGGVCSPFSQIVDFDELIKPIRLLNQGSNRMRDSSIDSPSELSVSYVSEESHCCK